MSQYGYRRKDGMYGLDADLKRKNDAKYKQDDEDEARAWLSALLEVSLEVRPPRLVFGCVSDWLGQSYDGGGGSDWSRLPCVAGIGAHLPAATTANVRRRGLGMIVESHASCSALR